MYIVYIITNLGQLDIHLTLCIISKSEYVVYNGCTIYYLTSLLVVTFIYYCYYNKYNAFSCVGGGLEECFVITVFMHE